MKPKLGFMAILLLSACGAPLSSVFPNPIELQRLISSGLDFQGLFQTDQDIIGTPTEMSPVVFNGSPILIAFQRWTTHAIEIRDFDGNLLKSFPSKYAYGSALVVGTRLYIFAVDIVTPDQTHIDMTYTDDLQTWSNFVPLICAKPGEIFFNSSVTATDSGYVMAYEGKPASGGLSYLYFALSPDLLHWTEIGKYENGTGYAAAPTIRYWGGTYYLFYLVFNGSETSPRFLTVASRSMDLINFDLSPYIVLAPNSNEGINASDLDLAEYNGSLYLFYMDGDQVTWDRVRRRVYSGTLDQFLSALWN